MICLYTGCWEHTYRDKIMAYACALVYDTIEEYVDLALECKRSGCKAFKIHPTKDWRKDIELCKAVREALGKDMILMLAPVSFCDREGALLKTSLFLRMSVERFFLFFKTRLSKTCLWLDYSMLGSVPVN